MLWKEEISDDEVADPEWHRQQEDQEYPRDFYFEQAVREMLILYRRGKAGFDLNAVDLSWIEWETITTISEWFEQKRQEREDALLGIKKTNGL